MKQYSPLLLLSPPSLHNNHIILYHIYCTVPVCYYIPSHHHFFSFCLVIFCDLFFVDCCCPCLACLLVPIKIILLCLYHIYISSCCTSLLWVGLHVKNSLFCFSSIFLKQNQIKIKNIFKNAFIIITIDAFIFLIFILLLCCKKTI